MKKFFFVILTAVISILFSFMTYYEIKIQKPFPSSYVLNGGNGIYLFELNKINIELQKYCDKKMLVKNLSITVKENGQIKEAHADYFTSTNNEFDSDVYCLNINNYIPEVRILKNHITNDYNLIRYYYLNQYDLIEKGFELCNQDVNIRNIFLSGNEPILEKYNSYLYENGNIINITNLENGNYIGFAYSDLINFDIIQIIYCKVEDVIWKENCY